MSTTSNVREFNEVDWYGFAGCMRFAGGAEPVCLSLGDQWFIIADSQGLAAFKCSESEEEGLAYFLEMPIPNQGVAISLLAGIELNGADFDPSMYRMEEC